MNGIILAVVAALIVLVMGVGLIAWYGAERLVQRRPPDPPATPGDYGLRYEDVEFQARDGVVLRGYWVPPPAYAAPTPVIVLCHGYSGSLDPDLRHIPTLNRAGYGVLTFDWRGHGRSEGALVSLGFHERNDLLGAMDWLTAHEMTRVGILGFSMGGAVAIGTAPSHPAIVAVVADGAFAQVQTLIEGWLRERYYGGPLYRLLAWAIVQAAGWRVAGDLPKADPIRYVSQLAPRALLLIHGAQDPYVPMDSMRALYRAARSPKALWVVPEAGHREADQRRFQEYEQRVVEFFDTYVKLREFEGAAQQPMGRQG